VVVVGEQIATVIGILKNISAFQVKTRRNLISGYLLRLKGGNMDDLVLHRLQRETLEQLEKLNATLTKLVDELSPLWPLIKEYLQEKIDDY
jgi:cell division cycle-associated protein 8